MTIDHAERRQYSRLLFSDEKRVTAVFRSPDLSEINLKADIVNLSEGGIGLRFREREAASVCAGELLYIADINDHPQLAFLKTVEAKVKWILDYQPSRGIRSGCDFLNLPDDIRKKIKKFINNQIEFRKVNGRP